MNKYDELNFRIDKLKSKVKNFGKYDDRFHFYDKDIIGVRDIFVQDYAEYIIEKIFELGTAGKIEYLKQIDPMEGKPYPLSSDPPIYAEGVFTYKGNKYKILIQCFDRKKWGGGEHGISIKIYKDNKSIVDYDLLCEYNYNYHSFVTDISNLDGVAKNFINKVK